MIVRSMTHACHKQESILESLFFNAVFFVRQGGAEAGDRGQREEASQSPFLKPEDRGEQISNDDTILPVKGCQF